MDGGGAASTARGGLVLELLAAKRVLAGLPGAAGSPSTHQIERQHRNRVRRRLVRDEIGRRAARRSRRAARAATDADRMETGRPTPRPGPVRQRECDGVRLRQARVEDHPRG